MPVKSNYHGDEIKRGIEAKMRGNLEAACILVQRAARENVRTGGSSGLHRRTGELINKIIYQVEGSLGRIGVWALVYARIHELGGITHPNVTERMRKWAWAMYYSAVKGTKRAVRGSRMLYRKASKLHGYAERVEGTERLAKQASERAMERQAEVGAGFAQQDFYKGIALTKKSTLSVHVPPRPYLRPALLQNVEKIREKLRRGIGR